MAFIDYEKEEIVCIVCYFGPGLAGKTSNILHVFETNRHIQGKVISLNSYPLLSCEVINPAISECFRLKVRFRLQTVVMKYDSSEAIQLSLLGADGIVFVADSHPELMERNIVILNKLKHYSQSVGYNIFKNPYVLQLNKRDWPNAIPFEDMVKRLRQGEEPVFEAVASKGIGVFETFEAVAKQIHKKLNHNLKE